MLLAEAVSVRHAAVLVEMHHWSSPKVAGSPPWQVRCTSFVSSLRRCPGPAANGARRWELQCSCRSHGYRKPVGLTIIKFQVIYRQAYWVEKVQGVLSKVNVLRLHLERELWSSQKCWVSSTLEPLCSELNPLGCSISSGSVEVVE